MKRSVTFGLALAACSVARSASATTRVCVTVEQKSWYRSAALASAATPAHTPAPAQTDPEGSLPLSGVAAPPAAGAPPVPPPPHAADARAAPHEIDPTLYLQRMLEYEVTHEPGFAAVDSRGGSSSSAQTSPSRDGKAGCSQRLTVELYPLESGWTVFARYSGTDREEKIDHAELDEFTQLAQRIVFALLRGQPITQTITRENVLRADSEMNLRTINGTGHVVFGMGTEARLARLPTAQGMAQPVADELRFLTPISVQVGYRRKLRAWGLDAFGRLDIGTENTGIHSNDLGGHVDYVASVLAGLHFLRYMDAAGVNSLYFGGGAAFEIAWFQAIRPLDARTGTNRDTLVGGGLNLDLLVGYEFLRASSVHFFGQIELDAPTYVINTENDSGSVKAYMPGALAQIGIIF